MDSVLVIDDEPSLADIVAELVSGMGFRSKVAYDGASALAALRDEPFAIIVCDVMMPGLSGAALADALRAVAPGMRLIIMSSLPEAHVRARISGTYAFLQKPFAMADLERALQHRSGGSTIVGSVAAFLLAGTALGRMIAALAGG